MPPPEPTNVKMIKINPVQYLSSKEWLVPLVYPFDVTRVPWQRCFHQRLLPGAFKRCWRACYVVFLWLQSPYWLLMLRDVMLCREGFGDPKNSKDYNCFRYPSDDLASMGPPEVLARAVVPSLAPSPRGAWGDDGFHVIFPVVFFSYSGLCLFFYLLDGIVVFHTEGAWSSRTLATLLFTCSFRSRVSTICDSCNSCKQPKKETVSIFWVILSGCFPSPGHLGLAVFTWHSRNLNDQIQRYLHAMLHLRGNPKEIGNVGVAGSPVCWDGDTSIIQHVSVAIYLSKSS